MGSLFARNAYSNTAERMGAVTQEGQAVDTFDTIPQLIQPQQIQSVMGLSSIKPFHGRMDSIEDPASYIEDIEYAVKMEVRADMANRDKQHRVLFRQNLHDRAEKWFATLPVDVRSDWGRIRDAFVARYRLRVTSEVARSVLVSQKVSVLRQGTSEPIVAYLEHCDDLEAEADEIITQTMGTRMVQGLTDKRRSEQILYDMSKEQDFSHQRAKDLIMSAYSTWDSSDPFHNSLGRQGETSMEDTLHQALQTMPQLAQGSSFEEAKL